MQAIKTTFAVSALTIFLGIQSTVSSAAILLPGVGQNSSLTDGEFAFAGANSTDTSFLDVLEFSLWSSADITATVANTVVERPASAGLTPGLMHNSYLVLSLFDEDGNFITATGDGGTLSALGLTSGETYTLTVSGYADGVFGGVYDGQLNVAAVPLPTAFLTFGSALLALGWRRKNSGE